MGFFNDLAKNAARSLEERVQKVNERKEELEDRMGYADDEELFRAIGRTAPMSVEFAALSLMLQERGYSSDEVVRRYKESIVDKIKHITSDFMPFSDIYYNNEAPGKLPGASNLFREEVKMSANVESMFYVRKKPWHGLGTMVTEAPASADALVCAGLDWSVIQKDVCTEDGAPIPGYKVNLRDTDNAALGIVSNRYKVVQNQDAFRFTDDLLGEGVTYETAGSLQGGRKVWLLARMPQRYIIAGDEIAPYLVVMNSHDGSSGIRVAMTPIRVVCANTLNLALSQARRVWTTKHTENVMSRVHEARETLELAEQYMTELGRGIDNLSGIRLPDRKALELMQEFFPLTPDLSDTQRKNNQRLLDDLKLRYWEAPDLSNMGKNGYRFINAVSDFATHADPIRKTKTYHENLFLHTVEGNPLIDRAYRLVLAMA